MSGYCDPPGGRAPGGGLDAGPDSGSSGTASCLQRWLDGGPGLALSQPQELAITSPQSEDRDPWLSTDGLRLYLDRKPGSKGGSDIYFATRTSTAVDFTTADAVINLDTVDDELHAALSGDEKLVVFSGNHATPGGNYQIFVAKRNTATDPFGSPAAVDQALVASVNTANDDYYDPFLSQDGLRLHVAPILSGKPQQIMRATRAAGGNFGPAVPVPVINSTSGDADPALSLDERIIVFSSLRPAGTGFARTNLWYATRSSATADFGPPQLIPMVNSDVDDGDPILSTDGCELYFASTRAADGKYHLLHARVMN
jgi:Tol biopolymer transport system component